jgi:hypothetical protein
MRKSKNKVMIQDLSDFQESFADGYIPGDIQRKKVKSPEEILGELVVELPRNTIKPVNGRIFLYEVSADEVKTKAGILLPTSHIVQKQDRQMSREIRRYYVLDTAVDCQVTFIPHGEIEPRKLRRGDEVFPFFPEEMENWSLPKVIDWNNNAMRYCVVHETEIGGACASLVEEEDEK